MILTNHKRNVKTVAARKSKLAKPPIVYWQVVVIYWQLFRRNKIYAVVFYGKRKFNRHAPETLLRFLSNYPIITITFLLIIQTIAHFIWNKNVKKCSTSSISFLKLFCSYEHRDVRLAPYSNLITVIKTKARISTNGQDITVAEKVIP